MSNSLSPTCLSSFSTGSCCEHSLNFSLRKKMESSIWTVVAVAGNASLQAKMVDSWQYIVEHGSEYFRSSVDYSVVQIFISNTFSKSTKSSSFLVFDQHKNLPISSFIFIWNQDLFMLYWFINQDYNRNAESYKMNYHCLPLLQKDISSGIRNSFAPHYSSEEKNLHCSRLTFPFPNC